MKLLLFSGGLDSTAIAYWLRPDELFFLNYGQTPAKGELRAATQIAAELDIPLKSAALDCSQFGAGEMIGAKPLSDVVPEFWPYRNQLLITIAAMAYAAQDELTIYLGTVSSDSVHSDGRPKFFRAMQALLACQATVDVETPASNLTALELQRRAAVPEATLAWSFSCHRADEACGLCRGCTKHFETIRALQMPAGGQASRE